MLGHLIDFLFKPPAMPEIELPIPARMIPGVKATIAKAFELAYHRGVYDGLIAGVLLALMFVPSLRRTLVKGASDVVDSL